MSDSFEALFKKVEDRFIRGQGIGRGDVEAFANMLNLKVPDSSVVVPLDTALVYITLGCLRMQYPQLIN